MQRSPAATVTYHGHCGMLALVVLAACAFAATAQEPTGAEVVQRARMQAARVHDKSMRITTTIDGGTGAPLTRTLRGFEKQTAEGRKVLWMFEGPVELAGTSFLGVQSRDGLHGLWVYFPAQRRVRQVADQTRRERFQGSQFTYDDLTAIFYFDYDGEHHLLGVEACGAATCDIVETTLPAGRYAYRRLVTWLRRDISLPDRIQFFGDGQILKTVRLLDSGTADGIPMIMAMEAVDARDGARTTIRYDDVRCNTGLPDTLFSLDALSHGK
jgi:outer membrane lipoprotein-sorting protein